MKKKVLFALMLTLALAVAGCGEKKPADDSQASSQSSVVESSSESKEESKEESTEESTEETKNEESNETVMSYAEYAAAELETEVVIEAYVQAKQVRNAEYANTSIYAQDEDGAYFIYRIACTEEEYAKLVPGTKIRVKGFKSAWSGEVEIIDASFEVIDGNYVAEATDVTALLGSDDMINYQNQFVTFKGMTVEKASEDSDAAFLYNWDGSGTDGNDLYFNVSKDGVTYNFTVESDLCDNTTDVYAAVKNLQVGQTVDLEGFLYWYNGVNPHITSVTVVE